MAVDSTKPALDSKKRREVLASGQAQKYGAYLGSLPKPITKMTGEDLRKFVSTRAWYGWSRPRKCNGNGCNSGANSKMTEVGALAIQDANVVARVDVPDLKNGVIIGYIQNFGAESDYAYGIPPGDEQWYFLWGGFGDKDPLMRLVKLVPRAGMKDSIDIDTTPWAIIQCKGPGHYQRDKPDGDMTGCEDRGSDTLSVKSLAFAVPTSGAWFSCSAGCCTSDPPQPFVHKPVKDTLYGKPGKDTGKKAPPVDTSKKKP
jgi:hypothetical protein